MDRDRERACRLAHICGHTGYFSNTRHIVVIMMPAATWEIQSSRGRICPTSHMRYWINLHREPVNRREKKDNPPRNGMKKQSSPGNGTA